MNSFLSRKRLRPTASDGDSHIDSSISGNHPYEDSHVEEESTEIKLATLASLYPDHNQEILLESLIAANGSINDVCEALTSSVEEGRSGKPRVVGFQTSLTPFRISTSHQEGVTKKRAKILTRKGQTLHLYSADDIAELTPCSIIHNFLPQEEADELLKELMQEASTYERQVFKLFDNVVQSPHSACFYVDNLEEQTRQKREYLYNGSFLTVGSIKKMTSSPFRVIFANHAAQGCSPDYPTDANGGIQGATSSQSRNRYSN